MRVRRSTTALLAKTGLVANAADSEAVAGVASGATVTVATVAKATKVKDLLMKVAKAKLRDKMVNAKKDRREAGAVAQ